MRNLALTTVKMLLTNRESPLPAMRRLVSLEVLWEVACLWSEAYFLHQGELWS